MTDDPRKHPDEHCACGKPEYKETGRCEECLAQDGWTLGAAYDEYPGKYPDNNYHTCDR